MADGARRAEIAVIGGTGLYHLLDDAEELRLSTPWGEPSGPVTLGSFAGRSVAFLPRHGPAHHLAPGQIPARANLWALRTLGVTRVVGPCAVGSLQPDIATGDMVVLDQLVDRTRGRPDTFVDDGVEHVGFADPYCPELSAAMAAGSASVAGTTVHPSGTVVVIEGPRFSTRAESLSYRAMGWHVINMTQYPEAYLARELGMCYSGLALVTDRDAGAADGSEPAVTIEAAMAVLAANAERTREALAAALPLIPADRGCACASSGAPSLGRGAPSGHGD